MIRSSEGPLSANIGNTDPAYRKEGALGVALETFENRVAPAEPLDETEAARRSADLVDRFTEDSAKVLDASEVNARRRADGRLPANLILSRDAGDHRPHLMPIRERFGPSWGASWRCRSSAGSRWRSGWSPSRRRSAFPGVSSTRPGRPWPRRRWAASTRSTSTSRARTCPPTTAGTWTRRT